mmetsp:Transcript_85158/g.189279  ORF Transcript_85158/g.189279 Transcript_85158/m.189279 type:complete len:313 (-) Transcript_85158:45-983(-)
MPMPAAPVSASAGKHRLQRHQAGSRFESARGPSVCKRRLAQPRAVSNAALEVDVVRIGVWPFLLASDLARASRTSSEWRSSIRASWPDLCARRFPTSAVLVSPEELWACAVLGGEHRLPICCAWFADMRQRWPGVVRVAEETRRLAALRRCQAHLPADAALFFLLAPAGFGGFGQDVSICIEPHRRLSAFGLASPEADAELCIYIGELNGGDELPFHQDYFLCCDRASRRFGRVAFCNSGGGDALAVAEAVWTEHDFTSLLRLIYHGAADWWAEVDDEEWIGEQSHSLGMPIWDFVWRHVSRFGRLLHDQRC